MFVFTMGDIISLGVFAIFLVLFAADYVARKIKGFSSKKK